MPEIGSALEIIVVDMVDLEWRTLKFSNEVQWFMAGCGKAGWAEAWHGLVWQGRERFDDSSLWWGAVRYGTVWQDKAWPGVVRHGKAGRSFRRETHEISKNADR